MYIILLQKHWNDWNKQNFFLMAGLQHTCNINIVQKIKLILQVLSTVKPRPEAHMDMMYFLKCFLKNFYPLWFHKIR